MANQGGRGLLRLQVNARAHLRAKETRLVGRLGRSDTAQFAGAVGSQKEERQTRMGGLEDCGGQLGDGGS